MNDVLNTQGYAQAAWWNRIPFEAWILMAFIGVCGNGLLSFHSTQLQLNSLRSYFFPFLLSTAFLVVADLDSPRGGLIQIAPVNLQSVSATIAEDQK